MKKLFLLVILFLLLCSCAGTGQQGIVNVPEQDVSFISPPSNWKRLFFTSTSQLPTGENVPVKVFIAAWKKSNFSYIGISGASIFERKKKISNRESLIYGLMKEEIEMRKVCRSVDYSITNETNGTLREGISFTAIEAEIKCTDSSSKEDVKIKTIMYALDSSNYLYTLQFKSLDNDYDKDIIVFEQILDSISFPSDLTVKPQQQSIIIGTGGSAGMYFPTGNAICRIVNKGKRYHGIHCTAKTTKGSVDNLRSFRSGDLQFGIARSELIYQAFRGLNRWKGIPQKKLRTIFSVHSETVHLMADSSLNTIQDLKRKKVNTGNPGWTNNIDALATLDAFQIDRKDINEQCFKRNEAVELFQKGQLDAIFYTVGDPNGITRKTSEIRNVNIIPLVGREIDELIIRSPFYDKAVIPMHWYPKLKNKQNIPTFGYKTILFTSAEAAEEVVYRITREVFNNFKKFKKQHPAYEELTKQNMVEILDKLAPIHPGALRYYKEVGLK
ncbi:MAG: TAXI family TRAP transporter solute-binding subunit [Desulfobacteraceae bacterium]|nr:TAXI family TRAP transporter solute-binding subunit [Desulfobacteraceae bacterium]